MTKVTVLTGEIHYEGETILAVFNTHQKAHAVMRRIEKWQQERKGMLFSDRKAHDLLFPLGKKHAGYDNYELNSYELQ